MKLTFSTPLAAAVVALFAAVAAAQTAPTPLLTADSAQHFVGSSKQVTIGPGPAGSSASVRVNIAPGDEAWPGARLTPATPWNLAEHGHVAARLTNTGAAALRISLRVDNAGDWHDSPWDAEALTLAPGETSTLDVYFGYSYGQKPGYRLDPAKVVSLLFFTDKVTAPCSFLIDSVEAAGPAGEQPPVAPANARIVPPGGHILGGGAQLPLAQLRLHHASAQAGADALTVTLDANQPDPSVTLAPAVGRWGLRSFLDVRVRLTNTGSALVTPRARVDSDGGPSDWSAAAAPLAAGQSAELTIPFAAVHPWAGTRGTGTNLTSDAVMGVTIAADRATAPRTLRVDEVTAFVPPPPELPAWLGQRPPVAGDWVKTFDDEFNGSSVDQTKWNIYTANYWDKRTHFSKDNTIVGNGVVRLHLEKKTGHQNDDPKEKETAYAVGFLDTYGKWTQRYGYFEARIKLPTAPGLWPAFWMMPDRGTATKPDAPQWERSSTANGGMEFDILEYLTRWGPYRYNIAMHWDGYGKDHKSTGSEHIYVQPDKDGYITAGLLWLPGTLTCYANGREVLRWDNPRVADVPEYLMFDLVTGGWDNDPLDDSKLPDDLTIDYVRCWQRQDLAGAK